MADSPASRSTTTAASTSSWLVGERSAPAQAGTDTNRLTGAAEAARGRPAKDELPAAAVDSLRDSDLPQVAAGREVDCAEASHRRAAQQSDGGVRRSARVHADPKNALRAVAGHAHAKTAQDEGLRREASTQKSYSLACARPPASVATTQNWNQPVANGTPVSRPSFETYVPRGRSPAQSVNWYGAAPPDAVSCVS